MPVTGDDIAKLGESLGAIFGNSQSATRASDRLRTRRQDQRNATEAEKKAQRDINTKVKVAILERSLDALQKIPEGDERRASIQGDVDKLISNLGVEGVTSSAIGGVASKKAGLKFDDLTKAHFEILDPDSIKLNSDGTVDTSKLQFREKTERDVRTVGGDLVEVGDTGVTVLHRGEKKPPAKSELAKAEADVASAQKAFDENPTAANKTRLDRATSRVNKVAGISTKKDDSAGRMDTARASVQVAREILNDGDTFGSVAGITGALKSRFGGLARQVGIPISTNSRSLEKSLEIIQAALGPVLLNEKRLSNEERARLTTIVGSLDGLTDEIDVANNLKEIEEILGRVEGRPGGEQDFSSASDDDLLSF